MDKRTVRKKKIAADKEIEDLAKQADSANLMPSTRSNSLARKSISSVTSVLLGKEQQSPEMRQKSGYSRRTVSQTEEAAKTTIANTLQPRSYSVADRKSSIHK